MRNRRHYATGQDYEMRDNVGRAFVVLRRKGMLARMNFSCCGSCGSYEMGQRGEKEKAAGKGKRGYVFWHQQTEGFQDGHGLMLYFGGTDPKFDDKPGDLVFAFTTFQVGQLICETLRRFNVDFVWNGETSQAIQITSEVSRKEMAAEEKVERKAAFVKRTVGQVAGLWGASI